MTKRPRIRPAHVDAMLLVALGLCCVAIPIVPLRAFDALHAVGSPPPTTTPKVEALLRQGMWARFAELDP